MKINSALRTEKQIARIWTSSILLLAAQLAPVGALAVGLSASAPIPRTQTSSTAAPGLPGRNLDFSSTSAGVAVTRAGTILVGGQPGADGRISGGTAMRVNPGSLVTPAMNAALWQVTTSGRQSLLLDSAGAARGGSATINSNWAGSVSSLVVPAGVTLEAIGFTPARALNVQGTANILGSLYTLQNASGLTSVINSGGNLNIGPGGLLSGNLPTGFSGQNNLFASQNLTLNVAGNFVNKGTVTVPGDLNVTVTGSLTNATPQGLANGSASMLAQNISILSGSGNIVNSGLIQATNNLSLGSMNLSGNFNKLVINNEGGVLQATGNLNPLTGLTEGGRINIGAAIDGNEGSDILLYGGLLTAGDSVNVFGRNMDIYPDQVVGPIATTGSATHLGVKTGGLVLGKQTITGDPTYFNLTGDIELSDLTVSANIAILANGAVTTPGTPVTIQSNGGTIYIASGVALSASPSGSNSAGDLLSPDNTNTISITGSGNPGGIGGFGDDINLVSNNGNITLVANGGVIDLAAGTINSGTGNVLAMAGGAGAYAFRTTGTITTTKGNVTIAAAAPVFAGVSALNGTMNGSTTVGAATSGRLSPFRITTSSATAGTAGGNIALITNGQLLMKTTPALTANGNTTGAGGNISISVGSVEMGNTTGVTISANGGASGPGGTVIVSTNSPTLLVIGAYITSRGNDIKGVISADAGGGSCAGGSVTIVNQGGGITYYEKGSANPVEVKNAGSGPLGKLGLYALGNSLYLNSSLGTGNLNGYALNIGLVSSGDITTSGLATFSFDELNNNGPGGAITLIAGANASYDFPTNTLTVKTTSTNNGNVLLSDVVGVQGLDTRSTVAGCAGGNFTAIAYGTGGVYLGGGDTDSPLYTGAGSNTAASGKVLIIGNSGVSLTNFTTVNVDTSGGTNGSGTVTIAAAVPTLATQLSMVNGIMTAGGPYTAGASTVGYIYTGQIKTDGAAITVRNGAAPINSTGDYNASASTASAAPGGDITISTLSTASLRSQPALTADGYLTGSGGTISVIAAAVKMGAGAGNTISANGGASGAGGNVIISTSSALDLNTGATSTGSGNDIMGTIRANGGTGGSADGGNITVVNNSGGINYSQATDSSLQVCGAGSGAGGQVGIYALGGSLKMSGSLGTGGLNGGLSNLALISTADVTTGGVAAFSLDESSTQNNGGNLLIVAGASASYDSSNNTLTINTTSANNGSINFSGVTGVSSIQTYSSAPGKSGGNFTAIAYGTGGINLAGGGVDWTLSTSAGSTAAPSGRVLIIGNNGVNLYAAPRLVGISSTGGMSSTGNVVIYAAAPALPSPLNIVNGIQGGLGYGAGARTTGAITTGAITIDSAWIMVSSGSGNISSTNSAYNATGGSIAVSTLGTLSMLASPALVAKGGFIGVSALSVELGAGPGVTVDASGVSGGSGGTINISTSSSSTLNTGAASNISGNDVMGLIQANAGAGGNGSGGNITVVNTAGGLTFSQAVAGSISVSGAGSGTGGKVGLYAIGGPLALAGSLGSGGANGGLSQLALISTGDITTAGAPIVLDESSTQNNGGNVTIIAGANAVYTVADNHLDVSTVSSNNGSIDLAGVNGVSSIQTNSSAPGKQGGSFTAVAYGGIVNLGGGAKNWALNTGGGSVAAASGDVVVLGSNGVYLNSVDINTASGTDGIGTVTVAAAAPTLGTSLIVVNGEVTGGKYTAGAVGGGATVTGAITTAAAPITVSTGSGGMQIGGSYNGSSVTLTSTGGGTITQIAGTVAAMIGLTIVSDGGKVGPLNIGSPHVKTTQNGPGGITLIDSVALKIADVSAWYGFSFTDTADVPDAITINLPIQTTGLLSLSATGGTNSGIILNADLKSGQVMLTSTGSGTISQQKGRNIYAQTSLTINAGTGDVGTLIISTPSITTKQSGTGSISLFDYIALQSNGDSTAGSGGFSFMDYDGIEIQNPITTSGPLLLSSDWGGSTGGIAIGGGAALSGGDVTLTSHAGVQAGGSVIAATLLTINAPYGNISLPFISAPSIQISQTGTGSIYLGFHLPLTLSGVCTAGSGGFTLDTYGAATTLNLDITTTGPVQLGGYYPFPITIASGTISGSTVKVIGSHVNVGGNISGTDVYVSSGLDAVVTGTITATTVSIDTTAGTGNITGGGKISGSSSVDLTTGNNGQINLSALSTPRISFHSQADVTLTDTMALAGTGGMTGANISLTDSHDGGMNITSNITATGTLQLNASGTASPITISKGNTVSGTVVTISATGDISLEGGVTGATSVAVDSTVAGAITGAGVIKGPAVTLGHAGATGLINLSGLSTPNVTFNTSGEVTLTDSVALAGNGVSTAGLAGVNFMDTAGGPAAIKITSSITSSGPIVLSGASAADSGIVLCADLNGDSIALVATDTGTISQSTGTLTANSLSITAGSGNVGNLNIAVSSITTSQTGAGSITLTNSQALLSNGVSTAGSGGFSLTDTADGGINLTSSIDVLGGTLSLINTGTNSPIVIGGTLTAGTVILTATGTGGISATQLVTASGAVQLTCPQGVVNVALSAPAITTTQVVGGLGSITIVDSTAVTTGVATAGLGGLTLTGAAGITIGGAIDASGATLKLFTSGTGIPIDVGAVALQADTLEINATGAITLGAFTTSASTANITGSSVVINAAIGPFSGNTDIVSKSGGITGSGKITAANLTLSATGGSIGPLSTNISNTLSATAGGLPGASINIANSGNLSGFTATAGGTVTLSCSGSVTLSGNVTGLAGVSISSDDITVPAGMSVGGGTINLKGLTAGGSFAGGTSMVVSNSGTIQSIAGNITIASAAGQDLTLTGNGSGSFIAPASGSINITATDDAAGSHPNVLLGPGNQSFSVGSGAAPGGAINITANGDPLASVTLTAGTVYSFPNDYSCVTITSNHFFGNPGHIVIHPSGQNPNSTLTITAPLGSGTIANSTGPVDLSQIYSLSFPGADLAILSAGDISNSSIIPLTIDLSGGAGKGGSLVLIAGFDFTPSTGGETVGPESKVSYTLTNPTPGVTAGGSINIGNVNINTSGAAGGGSVTAVAYTGTSPGSGAINLGTITTTGGSGNSGAVTLTGNGIVVGAIDTSAAVPANAGQVSITSTDSVSLSNPTGTMVSGKVTGGTFVPGTPTAAVTVSGINAGAASVALAGDSFSGSGLISAGSLAINVNSGNIDLANIAVSNLALSAPTGSINITNAAVLTGFAVTAGGSITLINSGDVILSTNINGPSGVTISLSPGSTLDNNGYQIRSSLNGTISLIMDSFTLSGSNPLDAGTGTVSIASSTADLPISIGASGAGLLLTPAQLQGIKASTVIIGSAATAGTTSLTDDLDISGLYNLQLLQGGAGGVVSTAGQTLNLGSRSLTIASAGDVSLGNIQTAGATINLSGSTLTVRGLAGSAADHITLVATVGSITGTTGLITCNDLSISAGGGNVGPLSLINAGRLSLTSSGSINVTNSGNLSNFSASAGAGLTLVNTGNVTLGGNVTGAAGVNITLAAAKTFNAGGHKVVAINAAVNLSTDSLSPGGTFDAGSGTVTITPVTFTCPITLGAAGAGLNLSETDLNTMFTAGTLVVGSASAMGGITVNKSLSLTGNCNLQLLQGYGYFVTGGHDITLLGNGNFSVNLASGPIIVNAITHKAELGAVSLQTNGSAGSITLSTGAEPSAHSISLLAGTGKIYGLPASIAPVPDLAGNGGSVYLSAVNLPSAGLTLSVNGTGSGSGGTASYTSTATSSFAPTAALLKINAGGVNAGTVMISTGGNFTFNPTAGIIDASPSNGKGANIVLTAGNTIAGALYVSNSISTDGTGTGNGGSITLNSNVSADFTLNGTSTNGIKGTVSVAHGAGGGNDGSVTITNRGGGISYKLAGLSNLSSLTFDTSGAGTGNIGIAVPISAAGNITLMAGGGGNISTGTSCLSAPSIVLASGKGSIGTGTAGAATAILVSTDSISVNTGGGSVNINNKNSSTLNLGASSAASTFVLTSGGNIVINGKVSASTATGAITLASAGSTASIENGGTNTLQAGSVTLTTGGNIGITNPLAVATSSLSASSSSGSIGVVNSGFNPGSGVQPITLKAITTAGSFTLASATAVTVAAAMPSAQTIAIDTTAGSGGITLSAANVGGNSTNTINLSTAAGGITGSGVLTTKGTGGAAVTLSSLTSGSFGSSSTALKVNTPALSASTLSGLINLSNLSTAGVAVTQLSAGGSVTFTAAAPLTFNNTVVGSSLTIKNTATTDGSISLNNGLMATNNSSGSASLTASGTGTITETAGTIQARTLTLTTAGGRIGGASPLQVSTASLAANSSGDVNLNNLGFNPGSGVMPLTLTAATSKGAFALKSSAGVTVTPTLAQAASITINTAPSSGNITLNGATLGSATTASINLATSSGSISGPAIITAASVVFNSSTGNTGSAVAPIKVSAANVTATSGSGLININDLSTAAVTVHNLSTTGSTITFSSAGPTTFNNDVTAGSITLVPGGNLVTFAAGIHIGDGTGTVTLYPSNASLPITLGQTGAGLNLTETQLNGIFTTGTLVLGSAASKGGITINSGSGGLHVTAGFNLQLLQGAGSFSSAGSPIYMNGKGGLSVSLASGNITVDSISFQAPESGSLSLQTSGSTSTIKLAGTPLIPQAHSISILAGTGKISGLPTTPLLIKPSPDLSGNGGSIYLSASNLTAAGKLTLDVSGNGAGSGGTASYMSTATTTLAPTTGVLAINVSGVNAGTAIISTGGNLQFSQSSGVISAISTAGGPSIVLTAGNSATGTLVVNGNLSADGAATGGSITLNSNNSTPFSLNANTANGINGHLSVVGTGGNGSIFICNRGGGIVDTAEDLTNIGSLTLSTAGSSAGNINVTRPVGSATAGTVSITTGGTGTITVSSAITANAVNLASTGGAIGTAGSALPVNTTNLTVRTGGTATVNIKNSNGGAALNLGTSASGSTFVLSTSGDLNTSGSITAPGAINLSSFAASGSISLNGNIVATGSTGVVTLTATGSGSITDFANAGSDYIQASTVTLNTGGGAIGSGTTALRLRAANLAANSVGLINMNNLGLAASGLTLTAAGSSGKPFTLSSAAAVKVLPVLGNASAITINTASGVGGITLSGNLGGSNTGAITLATGTGAIVGTASGLIATGASGQVNLSSTSGSFGAGTAALNINTATFNPSTVSGLINVKAISSGSMTVNSLSSSNAVTFSSSVPTTFNGNVSGSALTLTQTGTTLFNGSINASSGSLVFKGNGTGTTTVKGSISAAQDVLLTPAGISTFNKITASKGVVTVSGAGSLSLGTLSSVSSAATTFTVTTSSGGITTNGAISAGAVVLKNTAGNGGVVLNGNVSALSATGQVTLTAAGTGTINDGALNGNGLIIAKTVTLNTGGGAVGNKAPLALAAGELTVNATGQVAITNAGFNPGSGMQALALKAATSTGSFTLQSATAVTVSAALPSATSIKIDTSSGSGGITLGAAALGGAATGSVTLTTASGSITGGAIITTKSPGAVMLVSNSGGFGSTGTALKINTPSFAVSTISGLINVLNTNKGSSSVSGLSSGGSVGFASSGQTTFNDDVLGASVSLKPTGTTTFAGNIRALTGSVDVTESGSGATIFNSILAARSITLTTVGNTTFSNNATVVANPVGDPAGNGAISVTEASGLLSLGTGVALTARGYTTGGITLLEKVDAALSGINLGAGSSLSTFVAVPSGSKTFPLPGQISLAIGSVPATPVIGTAPASNVFVSPGSKVYWGASSNVMALAPTNNLSVTGNSTIVFAAGKTAGITLGGSTNISADPPPLLPAVMADSSPAHTLSAQAQAVPVALPEGSSRVQIPAGSNVPGFESAAIGHPFTSQLSAVSSYIDNCKNTGEMAPSFAHPDNQSGEIDAITVSDRVPGLENGDFCAVQRGIAGKAGVTLLRQGNTIFTPRQDIVVQTAFGSIGIDAGSMVLVVARSHGVAVYNLDDRHHNAVRVHAGEQTLPLSPGRHAMITGRQVRAFDLVNPIEAIGYRYVSDIELGKGLKAFTSEFSIPSAISAVKPLKQMVSSKRPEAVRLTNHLLKTVVSMMQMKPGAERYQQWLRPSLAACAQP